MRPRDGAVVWRSTLEKAEDALNGEGQTEILLVFPRAHPAVEDWKHRFDAHNESQRHANGPKSTGCRLWTVLSENADDSLHLIQIESYVVGGIFSSA